MMLEIVEPAVTYLEIIRAGTATSSPLLHRHAVYGAFFWQKVVDAFTTREKRATRRKKNVGNF